ncbi:MAG: hypothetical protein ACRC8Z_06825 [Empedobacter falsenii]
MKKLILTAIVGLAANFATAQNINFGIKGGAVFNTDKGKVWQDAGNIFKKDGKASAGVIFPLLGTFKSIVFI